MKNQFSLLKSLSVLALTYLIHSGANSQELTPADIYAKVSPAILEFSMYDIDSSLSSSGSAVAIGESGLVYTNLHIYNSGMRMELKYESCTIDDIKIIGIDTDNDILILKIPGGKIKGISAANSDSVHIGDAVYAVGNPLGFDKTLSSGLISGIRINESKQLQYTASISPGSSGGALLNSNGELIGVTSSTFAKGQNLNFAVPVNYYTSIELVNGNDSNETQFIADIANSFADKSLNKENEFKSRLMAVNEMSISNRNMIFSTSNILNKAGLTEKAIALSSHGISLYPDDKFFLRQRAGFFMKRDFKDSAISDLNKALELDSNYSQAILDRGNIYILSDSTYNLAKKDFLKFVSMRKGNEHILVCVAELCLLMKDTAGALRNLYNSYMSENDDAGLSYRRAEIYAKTGNHSSAAFEYTNAMKLDPESIHLLSARAWNYIQMADYPKAYGDYSTLLKLDPNSKNVFDNLGYVCFNLNLYDESEINFLNALKKDTMYVDAYLGLSVVYYKLNKIKLCLEAMSRAMHFYPVLRTGFNGLDSLKKEGFSWDQKETLYLKKVYKLMGFGEDILPGFSNYPDDITIGRANTVKRR